uniref:Uncharacterized protein n=1 Tax=Avena sativa TaxID=4498 RepID=A0ACD5YAY2_AVESA
MPIIQSRNGKEPIQQEALEAHASSNGSDPVSVRRCCWKKPSTGTVKINVDGSFIIENGQSSIGVIARNGKGEILFSAARMLVGCRSAEEVELQAIYEGLNLASVWIQEPVSCETECAEAAKAINKPGKDLLCCCFLINDIKKKVSSSNVISVTNIKRECNRVAHSLAAQARTCNSIGFWLGYVLILSEPLLLEDCSQYAME